MEKAGKTTGRRIQMLQKTGSNFLLYKEQSAPHFGWGSVSLQRAVSMDGCSLAFSGHVASSSSLSCEGDLEGSRFPPDPSV